MPGSGTAACKGVSDTKIKQILLAGMALLCLSSCASVQQEAIQAPVLLEELTVEAGSPTVDPGDFLTDPQDAVPSFLTGISSRQLCTPGSYEVTLTCGAYTYTATVHVVDTVAPTGSTVDLVCTDGIPEAAEFVENIYDVTEVSISYEAEPVRQNGEQAVTIVLTDTSGNFTSLEAVLTLDLDTEAPQIQGVHDILVDQGGTVSYRTGVTVSDDRDDAPVLSIDASQVDLSRPGEYTVVYSAKDAAGNVGEVRATVTVRELTENSVPMETVYARIDALLEEIMDEDMSVREQLYAIDQWAWNNCVYVSHSEKSDIYQAAYVLLTKKRGDCYNYYALAKVMMERLGIPNIDVRKVKNYEGDSDHYWSLVSLDGGQTWYHFDCSPRTDLEAGEYVHVFLFTDQELDAFSEKYRDCYNRDKSLYPATPEE